MAVITPQEVRKIAHISCVAVHDHELEPLTEHLEQVLTYAGRVVDFTAELHAMPIQSNVFRDDYTLPAEPEKIVAQAPDHEANFFVVPMIVEQ